MICGSIQAGKTVVRYRCQKCGEIVTADKMPKNLRCMECNKQTAIWAGKPIYVFNNKQ